MSQGAFFARVRTLCSFMRFAEGFVRQVADSFDLYKVREGSRGLALARAHISAGLLLLSGP